MTTVDPSNHICGGMEMSEIVGSGVFDQCLTQYQRVDDACGIEKYSGLQIYSLCFIKFS